MLDVSVAYNRYKFLGHEFLTWLWSLMENNRESLQNAAPGLTSLDIGNRIVCENRVNDGVETITIKGDDAGLEEGMLALKKGAVVTELNLLYTCDEQQWQFTLKGESLSVSNLKLPQSSPDKSGEGFEGAVLEKAYLLEKVIDLVNALYGSFLRARISNDWNDNIVPGIRKWIQES
jgi:hypothetical protein